MKNIDIETLRAAFQSKAINSHPQLSSLIDFVIASYNGNAVDSMWVPEPDRAFLHTMTARHDRADLPKRASATRMPLSGTFDATSRASTRLTRTGPSARDSPHCGIDRSGVPAGQS